MLYMIDISRYMWTDTYVSLCRVADWIKTDCQVFNLPSPSPRSWTQVRTLVWRLWMTQSVEECEEYRWDFLLYKCAQKRCAQTRSFVGVVILDHSHPSDKMLQDKLHDESKCWSYVTHHIYAYHLKSLSNSHKVQPNNFNHERHVHHGRWWS